MSFKLFKGGLKAAGLALCLSITAIPSMALASEEAETAKAYEETVESQTVETIESKTESVSESQSTAKKESYSVNYVVTVPPGTTLTGEAVTDELRYKTGDVVTVLGSGNMKVENWVFVGWAMTSSKTGIYEPGEALYAPKELNRITAKADFVMKDLPVALYSRWAATYEMVYDGNGEDVVEVPSDTSGTYAANTNRYVEKDYVTVLSQGNMTRDGYIFMGWNTKKDGTGQSYDPGLSFNMPPQNMILYAQWQEDTSKKSDGVLGQIIQLLNK